MASAVGVRGDYEAAQLRELAKRSEDANQTRRLLALAAIYDGGSRTEAAKIGGVGLQTVRDWVLAFNAEGPSGLVNGKAPGNAPLLTEAHRQALMQIVESGPIPAVHGVVRWRLIDLAHWVFEEFRIAISKQTLSRELRAMGLRKLSARPRHHAQDTEALVAFKKRMARPVRKRFLQSDLSSLRQRIRPHMRASSTSYFFIAESLRCVSAVARFRLRPRRSSRYGRVLPCKPHIRREDVPTTIPHSG
jgi:transposase